MYADIERLKTVYHSNADTMRELSEKSLGVATDMLAQVLLKQQ